MSLLKQISTQQFVTRSQQVVYEDVTFVKGFQLFLEALESARLVKNITRTKTEAGFGWGDNRNINGIKLSTTTHPIVENNFAGNVIVEGTPEALKSFDRILRQQQVQSKSITPVVEDISIDEPKQLSRDKMNIRQKLALSPKLQRLGSGVQTVAYERKHANSVIRHTKVIDPKTDLHLKFIKIALQHQDNPFFPRIFHAKLYAPANYMEPHILLTEMERLQPLHVDEMFGSEQDILAFFYSIGFKPNEVTTLDYLQDFTDVPVLLRKLAQDTHNEKFAEALTILADEFHMNSFDLHSGNWMIRLTGVGPQLVIVDPVASDELLD